MKRLIFSLAVIVIAAVSAAFTTPKANLDDAFFAFDYENHQPTEDNVEDASKWIRVFDLNGCIEDDEMACKMRVSSDYYSGSSLLPTINIVAEESAPEVAFVVSAEAVEIINQKVN